MNHRYRVGCLARRHQQSLQGGQGEGQSHGELSALTNNCIGIHETVNRFDVGLNHIHAHATSGNVRGLLDRGGAGHKYKVDDLRVAEPGNGLSGDYSLFDGSIPHYISVDAATVVFHGYDDVTLVVEGQ